MRAANSRRDTNSQAVRSAPLESTIVHWRDRDISNVKCKDQCEFASSSHITDRMRFCITIADFSFIRERAFTRKFLLMRLLRGDIRRINSTTRFTASLLTFEYMQMTPAAAVFFLSPGQGAGCYRLFEIVYSKVRTNGEGRWINLVRTSRQLAPYFAIRFRSNISHVL